MCVSSHSILFFSFSSSSSSVCVSQSLHAIDLLRPMDVLPHYTDVVTGPDSRCMQFPLPPPQYLSPNHPSYFHLTLIITTTTPVSILRQGSVRFPVDAGRRPCQKEGREERGSTQISQRRIGLEVMHQEVFPPCDHNSYHD